MGIKIIGGVPLWHSPDGINPNADGLRLDGTNVWSATTIYGQPIYVENVGTLSMHVSAPVTGTPNGSFALQGSNDKCNHELTRVPDGLMVNWAVLSFFDEATGLIVQSKAVSGAFSVMATIPVISSRWVRFVWTTTSGSALLTVKPQMKAVA
jgi:hypothetical protein